MKSLHGDRVIGILGLIGSIVLYNDLRTRAWETRVLPMFVLGLFALMCLLLAVRKDSGTRLHVKSPMILVEVIVLTILYVFLLKKIGFIIDTFCYLILFLFIGKYEGKKLTMIVFSAAATAAMYVIFNVVCSVRLPEILF